MTTDEPGVTAGGVRPPRPDDLMVAVLAVPQSVRAVRRLVRDWLDGHAWPVENAEDIELAVSEAITNVVDHAYPPDVPGQATLHAWLSRVPHRAGRRVAVVVTDRGRWGAHQPATPPAAARGHGLVVMGSCMAELHIQRSTAGTTVMMISAEVA